MSSLVLPRKITAGFYPERLDRKPPFLNRLTAELGHIFVDRFRFNLSQFQAIVPLVNTLKDEFRGMADDSLKTEVDSLRVLLRHEGINLDNGARTFALVREVAYRHLGMEHYDVQLIGGWVLLQGMVAEMETGEGKTLTATLAASTAALAGIPVHIVTVNDYLAQRDANWMKPIYDYLGLSVGVIVHGLSLEERRQAYNCDITYCTNKEIVFDYLKDRLQLGKKPSRGQRSIDRLHGKDIESNLCLNGLYFAIVDEADSILIDEARTPLIISGPGNNAYEAKIYQQAYDFATQLEPGEDFVIDHTERKCEFTDRGLDRLAEITRSTGRFWTGPNRREEIIRQALIACYLFEKDRDYLVRDGKVEIIDEFTGRTMADRSWERGLHQLVEVKESCEITTQKETLARISYQRFFRRYRMLSGMTGTAREVRSELHSVYRLPVVRIPCNLPVIRQSCRPRLFPCAEMKWEEVTRRVKEMSSQGRPVLVGTRSVATSEHLSALLTEAGLQHRVLNAQQDKEEADIIAQAGQKGQITVATNMAGRGTDIILGEGVDKLGGLYVLSTERHAARRIDRQLFGRCGRQGDPGSYELFASLDDEIFESFLSPLLLPMIKKLSDSSSTARQWLVNLLAGYIQMQVEKRNFMARRDLMHFDESLDDILAFSGTGE
jgi:preprotein translocase subunit SecA